MATTANVNDIEVDPAMVIWEIRKLSMLDMSLMWPQLDGDQTDYESAGYSTDTTSLSSTVQEYVFENGACPVI
jgi:hypothetical protein